MDMTDTIIFLLCVLLPLVGFAILLKKRNRIAALAFGIYLLSYLPFTLTGKYIIANHGGSDWRKEWCPKHLSYPYRAFSGRSRIGYSLLAALYWPPLVLDKWLWHETDWDPFGDVTTDP